MGVSKRDRDVVARLIWRLGCASPFRISRILLLAEWAAEERTGRRLTGLTYAGASFGFYVEELPSIAESLEAEGCLERDEERRCLRYSCDPPELPPDVADLLEEVSRGAERLDDLSLNRAVIGDPRYPRWVAGAGGGGR